MGEGGGRVSFMSVPMRSNTAGPGKTVAFTYQPINMKIFQQERRNALPPLDPNSIIGRVSAFLFSQPAKLAAHFPHSRAHHHRRAPFAVHRDHCRRSRSDIFVQTAGGRGVRLQFGLELSCLSVCHAPVARRRQPDSPRFLAPSAGKGILDKRTSNCSLRRYHCH